MYSSIVDVPCGYGRHSIELSNRWYDVVGVDINDEHLQASRDKVEQLPAWQHPNYPGFAKRRGNVQFIVQDMRTLCNGLYKPANAVIYMFYLFGFFVTDAENVQTMQQFHLALVDSGKFLMHSDISPEMFEAKPYRTSEMRTLREGGKLFIEDEFDKKSKRMRGIWTLKRDNDEEILLTPNSVRLYDIAELRTMARHVGFRKVSFFGSFSGEPCTAESSELVMVAEKESSNGTV